MRGLGLLEDPNAEQRRKHDRDEPGCDQRNGDDGEDRVRVLACSAAREPDGDEPGDGDQRSGEQWKIGRSIGEGCLALLVLALLQARDHHLDRYHGVVDQETEGDDEGAQRDSLKIDPEELHRHEHYGENERDRDGHHGAGAQAEADQADPKDDGDGLPKRLHELADRVLDGDGLVGDERRLDPNGQVRLDLVHGVLDVAPKGEDVAPRAHGDGEPDALFPVDTEHRLRRIGRASGDARDVAQTNDPAVHDEVDGEDVLLGPERARDADEDLLVRGLHRALRGDGVLGVEGGNQRGAVDPEARQLLGRELHIHTLVLGAEDVDLRDVRQLEELLSHVVHIVPQLPMREPVRGKAVDDAESVAELIVETRADDALRHFVADVVDFLANLVSDVRHLSRARRIFQVDEDRGLARGRVALQVVQVRRLLELALETVGDLLDRVADRCARPSDLHDHGLDGEVRILAAPEPEVGSDARHHDDEHEIDHERTMADRPFGEVEVHQTAPRRRTFWPGRNVCTPAVTTSSPVSRPWEITMAAGSYLERSPS